MLSKLTSHDYFLEKNGLMRKALAKDQTCLFCAFAEGMFCVVNQGIF